MASLLRRTCLAMLLVMAKKGVWVLEQPSSSLVFRLKRFQDHLVRKTTASQTHQDRPQRINLFEDSKPLKFTGRGIQTKLLDDGLWLMHSKAHNTLVEQFRGEILQHLSPSSQTC